MPTSETQDRTGWLPLMLLPATAVLLGGMLPPWILMWVMAIAIFGGFKWRTWSLAIASGLKTTPSRSMAFLFLWPGMDASRFLALDRTVAKPRLNQWIFALGKTTFGAALIWGLARFAGNGLGAGWIGMVGLVFFLHFGAFALLALFWQRQGFDAQPLMRWPVLAGSLSDFWGKRWNAGFRDLAFGLVFQPLRGRVSPRMATLLIFLFSGLIHELVITFPAGAGYGWPTLYFLVQGTGMMLERSGFYTYLGLRKSLFGRVFTWAVIVLPLTAVFPRPFILRVMVPFFRAIKALP